MIYMKKHQENLADKLRKLADQLEASDSVQHFKVSDDGFFVKMLSREDGAIKEITFECNSVACARL